MNQESQPKIVCLCGSTKFLSAFDHANRQETLEGRIVVSIGVDMHYRDQHLKANAGTEVIKGKLNPLHKRKIDLADEILVINVDGYIGDETEDEIRYAVRRKKSVRLLNPDPETEQKIEAMVLELDRIVGTLSVRKAMTQNKPASAPST